MKKYYLVNTGRKLAVIAIITAGILNLWGCRETPEDPKPEVETLKFLAENVDLKVGERRSIKIDVKPTEARRYANVTYAPSAPGYITVSEESNDGCVITAERGGIVILVAKAGSYTAYLEVKIAGNSFVQVPYIQVPTQVIEVLEGSRKTAQVNLYNGSAVDQQLFMWEVEAGKDNISINPTGNTVVVEGQKRGSQKIIIRHDKSEYDAEILVFVTANNESVRYITTRQNVITMTAGGASFELKVSLAGGSATDISGFTFSIMEDYPCIGILPSNNSCNITAYRKGTSVIKITHPLAEYELQVRVIVSDGDESYIEVDPAFKILDIGQNITVSACLKGYYLESWNNDWQVKKKGDTGCISITPSGGQIFVQAKETGRCILEIFNPHIEYAREALIVVRDPAVIAPDEYYITTSQNVIQLEAGQELPVRLSIQLINGIEPDKSNFIWTVEDSGIITVEPLDTDNIKYLRSMVKRSMSEIKSVADTIALVTPKKVGTTKIVIEHPKSKSSATVIVKVYPKGTFGSMLYVLGSKEGGLIKIDTAVQTSTGRDTPVNLYIMQPSNGDIAGLGKVDWSIRPRNANEPQIVASLYEDLKGLNNEVHGISKGINKLVVSNENVLKYPFEATVMVGTTEDLASMAVLYAAQVHQTLAIGQSVYVPILNSNMINGMPNPLSESGQYKAVCSETAIVNAVMIKNRLMLQGLQAGMTTVIVNNEAYKDAVPVEIKVTVMPGIATLDKPFMLTSTMPNFIGMNWGDTNKQYKVQLTGENSNAGEAEKGRIKWTSSNGMLVRVTGNGETALLSAGNGTAPSNPADMTGQANVTASHDKSINEKVTVVYVVPPGVDPESAVVLGIARDHWLLKPGDEVMMNLITNADDSEVRNINKIKWYNRQDFDFAQGAEDDLIEADYNGASAMVRVKPGVKGSTFITVKHEKMVIPLKIYISVSAAQPLSKSITLPSIIELLVNENKAVTAATEGMETNEKNKIEWHIDDDSVAGISTDLPVGTDDKKKGEKLYIKGKKRGQAWITVRQDDIGYVKKVLLVCANTYEELLSTYIMATEESYFRMKAGDVKAITLIYGSAGFPASYKADITWEDIDKNNVVKIHPPQYDYAEIEAVNEGIARVRINHPNILKPVDLTFEVSKEPVPGQSRAFTYTGMMGLVIYKGQTEGGVSLEYKEPYTKTATLAITPPGPSYSGIKYWDEEKPDKGVISVSPGGTGNEYMITGRAKGQTYVRFTHQNVSDDARIFVYTADTVTELQTMFPVAVNKNNYLLNRGDPAETIRITVPSQGSMDISAPEYLTKLNKISWDYYAASGSNVIGYTINESPDLSKFRQEVTVTPKAVGNCFFEVKYEGKTIDKIFISVREKPGGDTDKRIITENIIGLTPGTIDRKTSVGSNLTSNEKEYLEWSVVNPAIVEIKAVPGDKTSCYLTAKAKGNTEVIVSYGSIERYIKVYVTDNPDQYKEVNLDNRYYRLRKNDVLPLTAFHAALPAFGGDEWDFYPLSSPFDNKVIELAKTGKDKVNITGINEGIATVILHNTECATDVTFMVEVNQTAPLVVESVTDDWYMTAVKTVYAIDPAKTLDVTRIQVNGVRFTPEELVKIEWSVVSEETDGVTRVMANEPNYKPALLTLNNRKGNFIDIMPNNKIGTVVLRASHARSVNDMDITVICNAQMVSANLVPHISADRETVKLQLNEAADITVKIEDLNEGYDIGLFKATSDNPKKVSVSFTGNRLTVKGDKFGQALVSIEHPKVPGFIKKIIVIVMAGDTSLVYLTTKQNFVVIEKQNFAAVEVELVGYTDINARNYIWSTDDDDIISINDSGKSAVITAKNVTRTAKITVQHIACPEYPLYIYARVTEKNSSNPVYITTANNIVTIKEGAGIQVKATLVNGAGQEMSQFNWSTNYLDLIELNYSGNTALIKGIKPGTARINIWHPSSLNSITILVVVEPTEPNNGIYIAVDSQLVEMATSESQRLVRARLIGGVPEDVYGFQWAITNFTSVQKQSNGQSYQPITILTNADSCYIQPVTNKYEGEATITISHPKTGYKLDLKVIIADATDIKFGQAYVTVNQYSQQMVSLAAPSNGALNVTVQQDMLNPVIRAYATSTMCVIEGLKEGTAIVRISNVSGTKSDEVVVRVLPVSLTNYAFINITESLLYTKVLNERQFIRAQVTGATPADEQTLMQYITASVSNPGILSLGSEIRSRDNEKWNYDIEVIAKGAGNAELEFKVLKNTTTTPLFAKYPALEGAVKKVYFKVSEGNNVYTVDRANIQMYTGDVGEMITATIDMGKTEGVKAKDIKWTVKYPNDTVPAKPYITVDTSLPPNNETGTNTVRINAEEAGNCWIEVDFGGRATKQIIITVNPVEYLSVTPSNFSIGPGVKQTILVKGSPGNKDVSFSFDSNSGVSNIVKGAPAADPALPNPPSLNFQPISKFTTGQYGYWIQVEGNEYQGTVRLTFKMEDSGRQAQVTITNVKNYYARWIGKSSLRFSPAASENSEDVRIEYETNPDNAVLADVNYDLYDAYFKIKTEKDEVTGKKYIRLLRPFANGSTTQKSDYYPSVVKEGDLSLQFKTEWPGQTESDQTIKLPVYVYFDKIDVNWVNKNINLSSFDSSTYAVVLAPGSNNHVKLELEPVIKNSGEIEAYKNALVLREDYDNPIKDFLEVSLGKTQPPDFNKLQVILSVKGNENFNFTGKTNVRIDYKGVLTLKYEYYNGGSVPVLFSRKVLIYEKVYQ